MSEEQRVPGYENEPLREKTELALKTYEYLIPFNYPNVEVKRHQYHGPEFHGMELLTINTGADNLGQVPADTIVIHEDDPIVRVAVIGSACTPPGYVTLEAEPTEEFRRYNELAEALPVRFRIDNLWGMHLRLDQWLGKGEDDRPLPQEFTEHWPGFADGTLRCTSREMPLAGMSCAIFEIPRSKKVAISGGGAVAGWTSDSGGADDCHYSFRIIRTTVVVEQP